MTTRPGLLLIGHGSRSTAGVDEYWQFAERVREALPELLMSGGFIEFAAPNLDGAIDDLVARGATSVVGLPLVLLPAGHMKDDGPAALSRARRRHPGVEMSYARDLGVHPSVLAVAEERSRGALARLPGERPQAVVIVGRGSTDPDANGDLHKVARLLSDGRRLTTATAGDGPAGPPMLDLVEPAFVSLARPSIAEALDRAVALGAREVAVVPYFLFTGVLVDRIASEVAAWSEGRDAEVAVGGHLGGVKEIAELVAERYDEVVNGPVHMNCDCCIHRVALPGYEDRVGKPIPGA